MKHRARLLDVLRRAENGPSIAGKDFDAHVVAPAVKRQVAEHSIRYDKSGIVSCDDDLADRVFAAGLDLAAEVGIFCQTTSRRIIWTREELEEGLRYCPPAVINGAGGDAVEVRARRPEEHSVPIVAGGPYGVQAPEHLFVPMLLSYAQESVIGMVDPPNLDTAYGMPIKSASPWETVAGWREAELAREAIGRAGRPGLSLGCVGTSTTDLAQLSAVSYGGFRPTDRHYVPLLSEFKTNYHLLNKVVHATRTGSLMQTYCNPIYGGFARGTEGVAVAWVAGVVLLNQTYMGSTCGGRVTHAFIPCNTLPELLWAMSVALQAVSRNTNLLIHSLASPAGGPGTRIMLLENAAFSITAAASGVSLITCSQSAGGTHPRHASGLDAKICAEVARAMPGVSREEADIMVSRLVSVYQPEIKAAPIGKPFEEVYDVSTVEPTAEWFDLYHSVKDELKLFGLRL